MGNVKKPEGPPNLWEEMQARRDASKAWQEDNAPTAPPKAAPTSPHSLDKVERAKPSTTQPKAAEPVRPPAPKNVQPQSRDRMFNVFKPAASPPRAAPAEPSPKPQTGEVAKAKAAASPQDAERAQRARDQELLRVMGLYNGPRGGAPSPDFTRAVEATQRRLNELQGKKVAVDGKLGNQTRELLVELEEHVKAELAAQSKVRLNLTNAPPERLPPLIRVYQESSGLPVTGILDDATLRRMVGNDVDDTEAAPAKSSTRAEPRAKEVTKVSSKEVIDLDIGQHQLQLRGAGFYEGPIDHERNAAFVRAEQKALEEYGIDLEAPDAVDRLYDMLERSTRGAQHAFNVLRERGLGRFNLGPYGTRDAKGKWDGEDGIHGPYTSGAWRELAGKPATRAKAKELDVDLGAMRKGVADDNALEVLNALLETYKT